MHWTTSLLCFFTILVIEVSALGQEYRSSVVGTDFDFITADDHDTFLCLEYKFRGYREMPDKTQDSPLVQEGFVFVAYFDDGTKVDIAIDADFETKNAAEMEAKRYVSRLGKLPTDLRRGVPRMVVHKGDATAFGGDGLIVLYSENATKRIATRDLEETVFHESIHAAWDNRHAASKQWVAAQESDGKFVTDYGRKKPDKEDLAESALFAYTMIHHPERIPKEESERIRAAIPARIAFFEKLLPADKPVHYKVGPKYACDGSGKTFVVEDERYKNSLAIYRKQVEGIRAATDTDCDIDLSKPGQMSDILSNALMRGLHFEETKVRAFLDTNQEKHQHGDSLLKSTATYFEINELELKSKVQEYLHINCTHKRLDDAPSGK